MRGFRKKIYYTRRDRHVIVGLIVVISFIITLLYFIGERSGETNAVAAADSAKTSLGNDSSVVRNMRGGYGVPYGNVSDRSRRSGSDMIYDEGSAPPQRLFPFDPNTADSTALLELGLRPWQVRSIYRYRAKGGVFRKPSDFAQLYGLTVHQYRQLEPYIRISPEYSTPASTLFNEEVAQERDTIKYPRKLQPGEHIVLNTADTLLLRRVPGIGRGYARAIVSYGERLGGYVSVSQLDEIEDFPQEAKAFFIIKDPVTVRININKLPASQLRRHPYINYYQARAIADYRSQYGKINSLNDLLKNPNFTVEDARRLQPYIEF